MRESCLLLLLCLYLHSTSGHEVKHTALAFGKDDSSYVILNKDASPLAESFTVCSWVKRMRNERDYRQYWFSYGFGSPRNYEFIVGDTGYAYMLSGSTSYTEATRTIGEWHHICVTWKYSTRMRYTYYDGVQIGSGSTSSGRKLRTPATLMLGQLLRGYGVQNIESSYYFGGQLFDTNIYTVQLTADQVKEMFDQGRCGNYSQTFGENTFLSWSEILDEDRTGSVTEVTLEGCDTEHVHPEEEEEEREEEEEEQEGTWDFLRDERFFNKIISNTLVNNITSQLELLAEFKNHSIDDALISHLKRHHPNQTTGNETEGEEEETEDWDFLTDKHFYEIVVTEELILAFTDQFDLLAEFIGHRCDDYLIKHLNKHHS